MSLELHRQLSTYQSFHRTTGNTICHLIGVPLVTFNVVAMLDWVRIFMTPGGYPFTLAMLAYILVIMWYATLHVGLALAMSVVYWLLIMLGRVSPAWVVIATAVVGWAFQLIGHAVWEKRRPALASNLVQALVGPLYYVAVLFGVWKHESKPPPNPRWH
jgi:uncharacterized membrane protein YGL010W